MPDELNLCKCPSCQNTVWHTCPQRQAECNYEMLQCGYVQIQAENDALRARLSAAEELIAAQEEFDAVIGLPGGGLNKNFDSTSAQALSRLRTAKRKWEALE